MRMLVLKMLNGGRGAARLLLLFPLSAAATTYYVDPVNGNDSNDGLTTNTAWRALYRTTAISLHNAPGFGGHVKPLIQGGDTVILRGGLYVGNSNAIRSYIGTSGTPENPTTFKAYPGEVPVISHITREGGNPAFYCITLRSNSHWRFDGITWSNCYKWAGITASTNITFTNCTFTTGSEGHDYQGLSFLAPAVSNRLQNCIFRDYGRCNDECNDIGEHVGFTTGPNNVGSGWNLVEGCLFMHSAHDAIGTGCPYNVLRSNIFINDIWIPTNEVCHLMNFYKEINHYGGYSGRHIKPGDGETVSREGSKMGQVDQRNVYEWNTFLYTGPPSDDNGAFAIEMVQRHGIFRFNTIAFSLASGVYFTAMSPLNYSVSNAFYGNVVYGNGLAQQHGGAGLQSFGYGLGMNNSGGNYFARSNYVVNNIIWHNLPGNISERCISYQQLRNNFTNDAIDPLFFSTNGWGYTYDPNNLPDFRLRAGSPCIDAGTWLAYATASGSGTTLPVDNSLYFSDGNLIVPGDLIQLEGQTVTSQVVSNDWENHILHLASPLTWTEGQGVSLPYYGAAPDQGAFEWIPEGRPFPPPNFRQVAP